MSPVLIALGLVSLLIVSGLVLLPGWWRGHLHPAEPAVLAHGGLAMLLLGLLLLQFAPDGTFGLPQLVGLVVTVATGAMMFGARRKQKRTPRPLLIVHILAAAVLIILLGSALGLGAAAIGTTPGAS